MTNGSGESLNFSVRHLGVHQLITTEPEPPLLPSSVIQTVGRRRHRRQTNPAASLIQKRPPSRRFHPWLNPIRRTPRHHQVDRNFLAERLPSHQSRRGLPHLMHRVETPRFRRLPATATPCDDHHLRSTPNDGVFAVVSRHCDVIRLTAAALTTASNPESCGLVAFFHAHAGKHYAPDPPPPPIIGQPVQLSDRCGNRQRRLPPPQISIVMRVTPDGTVQLADPTNSRTP